MTSTLKRILMALPLVALLFLVSGCATTEPENQTARPWNSPTGWEHGLPVGLNEGR